MRAAALLVLAVAVGVLVLLLAVRTARPVVDDAEAAALAPDGRATPQELDVLRRYLARHRRHRLVGGTFGALLAFVVGLTWFGTVQVGIGTNSPLADLLFCTLAGVLAGALSAESFRLAEPRRPTASLAARPPLPWGSHVAVARALTAASLLVGALTGLLGSTWTPLGVALAGALLVGLGEATRRAVADRRRPVVSERAQALDTGMRSFAARSVAHLQLAAASLTTGWTVATLPDPPGALVALQVVVVLAALVTTVVMLHRAAPRPVPTALEPASA